MIQVEFPGQPKARAIIVDEPVNGVSGVVECDICDWRMVLMTSETEEISGEIEKFIKEHECEPLAREEEAVAFAQRLSKHFPKHSVRIMKGSKCLREF